MAAALLVTYKTAAVIAGNTVNLIFGVGKNNLLCRRNYRVYNHNGYSALCGILKACRLYFIKHDRRFACAVNRDTAVDNFTELFFADLVLNNIVVALNKVGVRILNRKCPFKVKLVRGVGSVNKAQILRDRLVEDYEADGSPDKPAFALGICHTHPYRSVQTDNIIAVGHNCLVLIAEDLISALFVRLNKGKIVRAENHILRRNGNRLTVRRL